jgi:hypothetical protein
MGRREVWFQHHICEGGRCSVRVNRKGWCVFILRKKNKWRRDEELSSFNFFKNYLSKFHWQFDMLAMPIKLLTIHIYIYIYIYIYYAIVEIIDKKFSLWFLSINKDKIFYVRVSVIVFQFSSSESYTIINDVLFVKKN